MTATQIQEIKSSSDALKIFTSRLSIRKNGREYIAKCFMHSPDRTPSLTISQSEGKWLWHCFPCKKGGSVIDFVMAFDKISFSDAAKKVERELMADDLVSK